MGVLLPKIKPLIYSNGGPVITVQVRSKNWMHYDLKFPYLPKATCYYITLRKRRFRSHMDLRKNGTPIIHALGSNMSPTRAPFFLLPIFFQAPVTQATPGRVNINFLIALVIVIVFFIAFRGKNEGKLLPKICVLFCVCIISCRGLEAKKTRPFYINMSTVSSNVSKQGRHGHLLSAHL